MRKKKFVYVLSYVKTFKAVQKNNPHTHYLQQNKKAVLTTATYSKAPTPVKSQGTITIPYLPLLNKKGVSILKQKK